MHRWLSIPLLLATFEAQAFSLPEIPFCPLGGPPGWFNRMVNDTTYGYPPPRYWYGPDPRLYPYGPAYGRPYPRPDACRFGPCPHD